MVRAKTRAQQEKTKKQNAYIEKYRQDPKYVFEETEATGKKTITEDNLILGYLEKHEMDQLFIENGFLIENLCSWWDFSPYLEAEKRELIYTLRIKMH